MDKTQQHAVICAILTETYKKKNADYGDSFSKTFKEYGLMSSALRLDDKLSRFKRLSTGNEQQVKTESMVDTLLDLANYAIMTIIEIQGVTND